MHGIPVARRRALLALFLLPLPPLAAASIWIAKPPPGGGEGRLRVVEGTFPEGRLHLAAPSAVEAYLIDSQGAVAPARVERGWLHFDTPRKGHHWVVYLERTVRDGVLQVELAKYRLYNSGGSPGEALLQEVRGRTSDSKYGRPPLEELPFELVLQQPQREHHVSCCVYAGDIAGVKVYRDRQPAADATLQLLTADGWGRRLRTDAEGFARFELPTTAHVGIEQRRRVKYRLLVTAESELAATGEWAGQPYQRVHYRMTRPLTYHPSAREWAAKQPAFLTVIAVVVALGFGVFLYRLRLGEGAAGQGERGGAPLLARLDPPARRTAQRGHRPPPHPRRAEGRDGAHRPRPRRLPPAPRAAPRRPRAVPRQGRLPGHQRLLLRQYRELD